MSFFNSNVHLADYLENDFSIKSYEYPQIINNRVPIRDPGYAHFSASNVDIDYRLILSISNTSCPKGIRLFITLVFFLTLHIIDCGGHPYSAGGWSSPLYVSYGSFSFIAKAPSTRGR